MSDNLTPDAIRIAKIAYTLIENNKEALLSHSRKEIEQILTRTISPDDHKALMTVLDTLPHDMTPGSIWSAYPINEQGVDEAQYVYIIAHTPQRDNFLMIYGDSVLPARYTDFHPHKCLWDPEAPSQNATEHHSARLLPEEIVDADTTAPQAPTPAATHHDQPFNTAYNIDNDNDDDDTESESDYDNSDGDIDDIENLIVRPLDYIYEAADTLNEELLEKINDLLANVKKHNSAKDS